jgi:hypothetical protein
VATFKEISAADVKTSRSVLNQLVDVIQEDISGSATRRTYQMWVTGGIGPGVTSSLYQTVYDQDFSLQTANPILDMTCGMWVSGSTVLSCSSGLDANGKMLFPSSSLMMREKIDVYKQYAASLLGNAESSFATPFGSGVAADQVDAAVFLSFKRLFTRDKVKRETFAIKMYASASEAQFPSCGQGAFLTPSDVGANPTAKAAHALANPYMGKANINKTSTGSVRIYTDFGSSQNRRRTFGGEVGDLVDSSDTTKKIGLIFYDAGTIVLNVANAINASQYISGTIDGMTATSRPKNADISRGKMLLGHGNGTMARNNVAATSCLGSKAQVVPDLFTSGSIDDIVKHFSTTRFSSGSLTAATFQNNTNINSTLIFCRATADEFNYSSNPTYTDSNNRIRVIDEGQEDVQRSFSFATTVGLYDVNDNLLAVAKLSRPIEKNDEKDLTVRVRLDF